MLRSVSRWTDPTTHQIRTGCNAFSIGIELANAGDSVTGSEENPKAFGKYACPAGAILARHKNGGPLTLWEKFPAVQLTACFAAAETLFEHYHLDDIRGHDDIAPERKNDPGLAFPMTELRAAVKLK